MLLSQQAVLARLDGQRAVVQVAGNWMAMVQSRLPLLHKAVATALGGERQVVLEASPGGSGPITATAAPAPPPVAPPPPATAAPAQATPPPRPQPPASAAGPASNTAGGELLAPEPQAAATTAAQPGLIDEKARRLAEFFNGEVLPLEEALPGLSGDSEAAA